MAVLAKTAKEKAEAEAVIKAAAAKEQEEAAWKTAELKKIEDAKKAATQKSLLLRRRF